MKNLKGVVFALISSGTFGLIPLFSISLMREGMDVLSILFYRFLFSTIIMGTYCIIQRKNLLISKKYIPHIFFFSSIYFTTAISLLYSYNYMPSGVATTIHFLYPIVVSIIMIVFFKERKSTILFVAALLSLIGVLFLCWTNPGEIKIQGIFLGLLAVISYAIYIVLINKSKIKELEAEVLSFYIFLFAAIIFFTFTSLTTGIAPLPEGKLLGNLISLSLFSTVISGLTLLFAIRSVGSTTTSILGSMEPLVAVLVGVFYFSEHFDVYSFIGVFLIIFSVTLVIIKTSNTKLKTKSIKTKKIPNKLI